MKEPSNVKLTYLYRDSGNYKAWGEVVFSNPSNLSVDVIELRLRKALDMGCLFIAHQVQIPEVFLYLHEEVIIEDHCFHEFDSVVLSDEDPNDQHNRPIDFFVRQVEMESHRGWQAFDPFERSQQLRNQSSFSNEAS